MDNVGVAEETRLLSEIAGRQPIARHYATRRCCWGSTPAMSAAIKRSEDRGAGSREQEGEQDGHQRPIVLLPAGRAAFDALDDATRAHSGRQLESLGPGGGAHCSAITSPPRL